MDERTIKVSKCCPVCKWRLFDKVSPSTGFVEIKCPHCHSVVKINLALRRTVKKRLAKSA